MSVQYNFQKPITNKRKFFINLNLTQSNSGVKIDEFISLYKISNFWRGKIFIKKLINKIFKYRIDANMKWNKNFWDLVNVYNAEYDYSLPKEFSNLNDFRKYVVEQTDSKRMKDILNYEKLILSGVDINCPLFINGLVLNKIGANVDKNDIFLLDGSRRLISNILSGGKYNKALIITCK